MRSFAIFCEDIVEQVGNKNLIVGTIGTKMIFDSFPALLGKICVSVQIDLDTHEPIPNEVLIRLKVKKEKNVKFEIIPQNDEEPDEHNRLVFNLILPNFPVDDETPLIVLIKTDRDDGFQEVSRLQFEKAPDKARSNRPYELKMEIMPDTIDGKPVPIKKEKANPPKKATRPKKK